MGPTGKPEGDSASDSCDRTRSNGNKLKEGKLRLGIRKKFFTLSMVIHWNSLPREFVDASSVQGQAG